MWKSLTYKTSLNKSNWSKERASGMGGVVWVGPSQVIAMELPIWPQRHSCSDLVEQSELLLVERYRKSKKRNRRTSRKYLNPHRLGSPSAVSIFKNNNKSINIKERGGEEKEKPAGHQTIHQYFDIYILNHPPQYFYQKTTINDVALNHNLTVNDTFQKYHIYEKSPLVPTILVN